MGNIVSPPRSAGGAEKLAKSEDLHFLNFFFGGGE